jgi:hypothetical protein
MTLNVWGDASWGDASWGGEPPEDFEFVEFIDAGRNINSALRNWDIPPTIQSESNDYDLVNALVQSLDEIDNSLELIYNNQHIDTASGDDLDRIGEFVGVKRETEELDRRYRTRIKARFRAATIEPTTDTFTEFVSAILSTDVENFSILRTDFRPKVTVSAQSAIWQNNELTEQTLVELLERGVPAGHAVNIQEQGTFELKSDGQTDDPDKGLTSDSTQNGGTLATDVV